MISSTRSTSRLRRGVEVRPPNERENLMPDPQEKTVERPVGSLADEPYFSIIIPCWNRAKILPRCLDSCLSQSFARFEIVIVDDGSTDGTADVARRQPDARVRLAQRANGGPTAARYTGTQAARGRWFVYVDSDWELLPGALGKLFAASQTAGDHVGVLGMLARWDTGETSPDVPFPPDEFGFVEWLKWCEHSEMSDYLICHRRKVYDTINWPTDRRLEPQFMMKVASRWRERVLPDVGAVIHTDEPNRITRESSQHQYDKMLRRAPAMKLMYREILDEFGQPLRQHVPALYLLMLRLLAYYSLLTGDRQQALGAFLRHLAVKPFHVKMLGILVLGLVWPKRLLKR
jgi:glycosyltransferase involved in cell wall biosynthesis